MRLQVMQWRAEGVRKGLVIRITDDQLYIVIPLTPWIERRKSIGISKSLIIDNYLTGIHIMERISAFQIRKPGSTPRRMSRRALPTAQRLTFF